MIHGSASGLRALGLRGNSPHGLGNKVRLVVDLLRLKHVHRLLLSALLWLGVQSLELLNWEMFGNLEQGNEVNASST